jgi:antitoxin component of MazEF toxin-antitoxin module
MTIDLSSGAHAMMTKKLSKHGNSLALVIDRSILELLDIDEETPLQISTDGRALVIAPAHDTRRRERFERALSDCNEQFGPALKRLAETAVALGGSHLASIADPHP